MILLYFRTDFFHTLVIVCSIRVYVNDMKNVSTFGDLIIGMLIIVLALDEQSNDKAK